MGESTNVALEQRIPVWVELVPLLLAHLGIKHVALVSHSAGTMYLFNTLHYCREILHPERPFVALLGMPAPAPALGCWYMIPAGIEVKNGREVCLLIKAVIGHI
jgi:hypothetical protein